MRLDHFTGHPCNVDISILQSLCVTPSFKTVQTLIGYIQEKFVHMTDEMLQTLLEIVSNYPYYTHLFFCNILFYLCYLI